jgi:flagellar biosynthesis/type III secretory pathway protein FliH
MSSSDRLERPKLPDLSKVTPQPWKPDFRPRHEFEPVRLPTAPPISAEEAHQNGLVEGEKLGRAAAMKELVPVLEELGKIASAMRDVRVQRLAAAEADLADVAAEIARRILHGELQAGGDIAVRMARAVIAEANEAEGERVLHVAPADAELLRTHLPELQLDLSEGSIKIQADPAVSKGGVVLATSRGCYEGRPGRVLEASLEKIAERKGGGA